MSGEAATIIVNVEGAVAAPAASGVALPGGGYQIGREIGRGGMGSVLEADDCKLGRRVALKVMRLTSDATEDQRQRFIREASVLARLEHPNIVPIHDLGRDEEGALFYTMKLVHGRTLQAILDLLRARDPETVRHYTLDRLLTIFRKVCDALSLAHAKGVIHRDLKPENVMVGEFGEVLVMDWGIAKVTDDAAQSAAESAKTPPASEGGGTPTAAAPGAPTGALTMDGAVMGTPQYMSPEQAEGRLKDLERRSDVFSLGGILYAILTLRPPVEGATAMEALHNVRTGNIREPTQFSSAGFNAPGRGGKRRGAEGGGQNFPLDHCIGGRVPAALSAVAMVALSVKKEDRYATVAEFAADIEAYQHGFATRAEHAGLWTQVWLLVKRNKVLAASAALLAVLSVAFTMRVVKERDHARAALAETERQKKIAQDNLDEQLRQTASLTLREGMNLCERGDVGRGLQWMVRALKIALDVGDRTQARAIRLNLGAWSRVNHTLHLAWRPPVPGAMRAFAFSPEGRRILTGDAGTAAQLWDTEAGTKIGAPLEHSGEVVAVAFSGDGRVMATACRDRTARVWDVATGRPLTPPLAHGGDVVGVKMNHDGSRMLTASKDRQARIWDTATGMALGAPLKYGGEKWSDEMLALALSPDGRVAFTASAEFQGQFWDGATGEPIGKALDSSSQSDARWFFDARFSNDGSRMVSGGSDNTVRIWDVQTRQQIGTPLYHSDYVLAVAFSPDGSKAVSGGKDQTVRVWDLAKGRQMGPSLAHRDSVDAVAVGPDGRTVWTGTRASEAARDPGIRCWTLGGHEPVAPVLQHPHEVWHAHFHPDEKSMITVSQDDLMRQWDIGSGRQTGEMRLPGEGHIHASSLSPDGRLLAIGSCAKWSFEPGSPGERLAWGGITVPRFHYGEMVWDMAISRDGSRVIAGGRSKDAQVWDAATAKPIGGRLRHLDEVTAVSLSPDGTVALTASDDRTARLWTVDTGLPIGDPLTHEESVKTATFSPDGRRFLTADGPNVWLWDTATRYRMGNPLQQDEYVQYAGFRGDGELIVTISDNGAIVWDAVSGRRLGPSLPHRGGAHTEFSRDGRRIVTSGRDKTARVWLAPFSIEGKFEQVAQWAEVVTGTDWDERGSLHVLDIGKWEARHALLLRNGGASMPGIRPAAARR